MEALLEKEGDVERWNDERMDELSRRMDTGFEGAASAAEMTAVKSEVARGFDKADREFARLNDRLDKLFWGIGFVGLTIGFNILADNL
jgi:hypothetical protein